MKIFLSYSSTDVAWARKLKDSLSAHDVFFDKDDLRAGANWERQLLTMIPKQDHVIVLWSAAAKASPWVNKEVGYFDGHRIVKGEPDPKRHLIHVLLDDTGHAYGSDQAIAEIRDAKGYPGSPDALPAGVWDRVMSKISDAIYTEGLPVSVAIVTVTKDCLIKDGNTDASKAVDFNFRPAGGQTLQELLDAMKLTREELAAFYDTTREGWRPFGGQRSIGTILDTLKTQLNALPNATPIRWVRVDDDLLSDDAKRIDDACRQLASGLSLIVFDPIALYSRWTKDSIIQYLEGSLANPNATVAVLPVFRSSDEPRFTHTRMIKQMFGRLVEKFYEEPAVRDYAQCSIFTPDDSDMRRLVRRTLKEFSRPKEKPGNAFLGLSGS